MHTFDGPETQQRTKQKPHAQNEQRGRRRYSTSQIAELIFREQSAVVEAIDVSASGARCRIVSGFAPMNDDLVKLVFLDGTRRSGTICWSDTSDFGIEFDDQIDEPEDLTHFEHLGIGYYQSIIRLQKKRQAHVVEPGTMFQ